MIDFVLKILRILTKKKRREMTKQKLYQMMDKNPKPMKKFFFDICDFYFLRNSQFYTQNY